MRDMRILFEGIFLLFIFSSISDLAGSPGSVLGALKYVAIICFSVVIFVNSANRGFNLWASAGLFFFCLMTALFTLFNLGSQDDYLVVLGYFACASIYFYSSRGVKYLAKSTKKIIILSGILFLLVNLFYIKVPTAYTFNKSQYMGILANPNALAGLTGLFLVLFFSCIIQEGRSLYRALYTLAIFAALVILFLAGSRGVGIAAAIAVLFAVLKNRKYSRIWTFVFLSVGVLISLYLSGELRTDDLGRTAFEDTGRTFLLQSYINKLSETYIIFGTGVSKDMGRIKSELSYLDVALFSGIGFFGFLIFLFSSVRMAIRVSDGAMIWASSLFIYIVTISLVEGYAANVASIPSLLFYLIPGILYAGSKKYQSKALK